MGLISSRWIKMPEIMNVLRERARDNDEKNDIYFTAKQKRVLKTIAENPHASASEVADMAEVHPSYIPYICERVDMEVVDNLHRLDEYLTEREEMNTIPREDESPSKQSTANDEVSESQAKEAEEIMETFGAKPTVDDHQRPPEEGETTEFTFTKEVPVQISVRFPNSEEITQMIEEEQEGEDEDRPELVAD